MSTRSLRSNTSNKSGKKRELTPTPTNVESEHNIAINTYGIDNDDTTQQKTPPLKKNKNQESSTTSNDGSFSSTIILPSNNNKMDIDVEEPIQDQQSRDQNIDQQVSQNTPIINQQVSANPIQEDDQSPPGQFRVFTLALGNKTTINKEFDTFIPRDAFPPKIDDKEILTKIQEFFIKEKNFLTVKSWIRNSYYFLRIKFSDENTKSCYVNKYIPELQATIFDFTEKNIDAYIDDKLKSQDELTLKILDIPFIMITVY